MPDLKNIEISKIIVRLQIIKSLITLEEENEISVQISRLRQFSLNGELDKIIILLEEKSYSKVVPAIEAFINLRNQVGVYIDPELEGLRLEAKVLEAEVNQLSDEKADLEKLVHDFEVRHNYELGELILKILRFRKNTAKGTPKEAEADNDYNEFSKEYEIRKEEKINELSEDEYKELKQKFRKASKLCHPDLVSEEQKELADKLFSELNAAYARNDLNRVSEILQNLEKGSFFVSKSESITEKQLLKAEIENLRLRIGELKIQVFTIKSSEAFASISSINNWDNFFKETKTKLEGQLKELENAG